MTVPNAIRCDHCGWPGRADHVWGWYISSGKVLCPLCVTILQGPKPTIYHMYPEARP
ncbi:MAG: hypothetical protein LKJ94_05735 [Candidatus Methanomethylophilus sp.]|nr:hypothetical protein [Methanomethylophilus sp.]MCI2092523.1 hypothetical protein [Methanomethylophilus sp.]